MDEKTYPLRETLLSCGVMLMTAGFMVILLSLIAVLVVVFWS
jgi:hypothetical protein